MDLYLLNIFLVLVWYLIIRNQHSDAVKKRRLFFIIVTIQVLIFHAFRDPFIYPDNDTYAIAYDNIRQMSFHEAIFELNRYTLWGPGYVLLNWILGALSEDSSVLFYLTSSVIILCTFWFFYKTSYSLLFSVVAFLLYPFLLYQSMYAIRQHSAAALLLLSLFYINRLRISVPLFILATLFHTTAIVFAPFYFFYFYFKKLSPTRFVVIGVLILAVFNFGMDSFVQNVERFEHYQEVKNSNTLPLIVIGSILMAHIYNKTYKYNLERYDNIIFKYLVYATFILVGLMGTGGGRLASYFVYIMPVSFPMIFKYNKSFNWWKPSFVFVYMVALCYLWFSTTTNEDFARYRFIF